MALGPLLVCLGRRGSFHKKRRQDTSGCAELTLSDKGPPAQAVTLSLQIGRNIDRSTALAGTIQSIERN
jgi:hypothetical protein